MADAPPSAALERLRAEGELEAVAFRVRVELEIAQGKRIATGWCRGMPIKLFRKYAGSEMLKRHGLNA